MAPLRISVASASCLVRASANCNQVGVHAIDPHKRFNDSFAVARSFATCLSPTLPRKRGGDYRGSYNQLWLGFEIHERSSTVLPQQMRRDRLLQVGTLTALCVRVRLLGPVSQAQVEPTILFNRYDFHTSGIHWAGFPSISSFVVIILGVCERSISEDTKFDVCQRDWIFHFKSLCCCARRVLTLAGLDC